MHTYTASIFPNPHQSTQLSYLQTSQSRTAQEGTMHVQYMYNVHVHVHVCTLYISTFVPYVYIYNIHICMHVHIYMCITCM